MSSDFNDPSRPCEILKTMHNRSAPDSLPIVRDTSWVFAIIGLTYCSSALVRFLYFRKYYDHLRKRRIIYVMLTTLGACFQISSGVLYNAYEFECWSYLTMALLVIPLLGLPVPLRMLDHLTRYVYAKSVIEFDNRTRQKENIYANETASEAASHIKESWLFAIGHALHVLFTTSLEKKGQENQLTSSPAPFAISDSSSFSESKPLQQEQQQQQQQQKSNRKQLSLNAVLVLRFLESVYTRAFISIILLLPFALTIVLDLNQLEYAKPIHGCRGCKVNNSQSNAIIYGAASLIVFGVVVTLLVRRYPDPFGIMTESRVSMQYGGVVSVIAFYLSLKIPHEQLKVFSFSYITCIGMMMIQFAVTDLQIIIAKRQKIPARMSKVESQAASSTSPESEISKIHELRHYLETTEVADFEEYLIGEYSVEILRMFKDCHYYEFHYFDMNDSTRRAHVKRIVNKYLNPNSILEVNLPDSIKEPILNMNSHPIEIPPQQHIFKQSQKELLMMLYGSWQRYISNKKKKEEREEKKQRIKSMKT